MADEVDSHKSIDSTGRAEHITAGNTEEGEVNERHEQPQQRGERLQHSLPTETMKTDSRTPENVVVAAGISVDVHAPPNSAAAPQHPSERSGPRPEQLSPREHEQQSTSRSATVPARHSTPPASPSSNVATPVGGDTTSPYRAVYPREHSWEPTGPGGSIDSGAPAEREGSAFSGTLDSLRGFASRARDSVVRVAHGDFSDIRRAGQSIHRVGTGDFSELAGIERYLAGVFDECAAFGEKFCPCVGPETGRSSAGRTPAGPPPIMMLVDTPGGPYIRLIPDALVEESVRQGLLSAAEVEHQRQGTACAVVSP